MADFGPYTPPGTSAISAGVAESNIGGCPGGAASWTLNASNCVTVNHLLAEQTAILTNWSASITDGFLIVRVKVRVKGTDPAGTLKAQLYHSGGVVGGEKSFTLTVPYDQTFDFVVNVPGDGWNVTGITEAIVEGSGFGVKLTWTAPGGLDLIAGASIEIEAAPVVHGENQYSESAWNVGDVRTEKAWNTDNEYSEPAWQVGDARVT